MLPPTIFDRYEKSHDGHVRLVMELSRTRNTALDDMFVISELILHLETRVHELEKEVKRLQDEKVTISN